MWIYLHDSDVLCGYCNSHGKLVHLYSPCIFCSYCYTVYVMCQCPIRPFLTNKSCKLWSRLGLRIGLGGNQGEMSRGRNAPHPSNNDICMRTARDVLVGRETACHRAAWVVTGQGDTCERWGKHATGPGLFVRLTSSFSPSRCVLSSYRQWEIIAPWFAALSRWSATHVDRSPAVAVATRCPSQPRRRSLAFVVDIQPGINFYYCQIISNMCRAAIRNRSGGIWNKVRPVCRCTFKNMRKPVKSRPWGVLCVFSWNWHFTGV